MADSVAVIMSTTGILLLVTAYPTPLMSTDVSLSVSSLSERFLTHFSVSQLRALLPRQFVSKSEREVKFPL